MNSKMNTKKTLLASMVGLFAAAGGASSAMAQGDEAATEQGRIDEIIVTANKREQSLQDTEMSLTAISGNDINRRGLIGMGDYLATIPSVSQADFGVGRNRVTMRGIAGSVTDETTVGIYLGEIPLASIGAGGAGAKAVDIKLIDMERIEVLRGPQGTLYGSGNMGGAVRNIPKAPNLEEFEAEGSLGLSYINETSGDSNKATGVINIPLIENQLALRVAAYRFENQGYTDIISASNSDKAARAALFGAVVVDQKNVGDTEFTGGRISLLWQPTNNLSVTLMQVIQDLEQDGYNEVDIREDGYNDIVFDLNGHFGGRERLTDDSDFTNLVIEYDFGWGSLVSSSTSSEGSSILIRDLGRNANFPLPQFQLSESEGFIQELRLVSKFDGAFQLLAGLYYENLETILDNEFVWGGDPSLLPGFFGTDPNGLFDATFESHIQQKAVFGELSYEFSDRFKFMLGGRWFDYDRRELDQQSGAFAAVPQDVATNESNLLGKVNFAYTPNDDALVYAQWAQGFRLGKPVSQLPKALCDANNDGIIDGSNPQLAINEDDLESDTLDSYELGGKFNLLDNRLVINSSIYRLEWEGIPISVPTPAGSQCFGSVFFNAGEAVSQGLEIEITYQVLENLHFDFGASYNDAELSKDSPSLGVKGDRLPLSPRSNANIAAEYGFNLMGHEAFVRGNYAYVGSFYKDLQESSFEIGDYGSLNLRVGVTLNNLDIELYGTNLTNSNELVHILSVNRGYRVAPRKIGLNIGYRF